MLLRYAGIHILDEVTSDSDFFFLLEYISLALEKGHIIPHTISIPPAIVINKESKATGASP